MTDVHIESLAEILLTYCTRCKPHDIVLIKAPIISTPLVEALYRGILVRGGHPEIAYYPDTQESIFYTHASDPQLQYVSPLKTFQVENADSIIEIRGDINTHQISSVPSEILARRAQAQQSVRSIISQRIAEGALQWVLTMFPTHALAQQAEMSLLEYEYFFYDACFIHDENPLKKLKSFSKRQKKIAYYLNKKSHLRIVGTGTDISMHIRHRKWINADGHRNFPSGEIFTCPVENSVEGTIQFSYPGLFGGKEIEDIELTFEEGKVVASSARTGNETLQAILTTDNGSSRLGEVAIGNNPYITTFTRNMLLDEKMGGTIHLALGRSFRGTRGKNQSALHWDLLKDMRDDGSIYADDEIIYEQGIFLI
jgi:aminopeptidase